MDRTPLIRFTVAAVAGAIAGVSIVAVLSLLNAEGFKGCTVTAGWGVLVPIITGVFVGGAAWGFFSVRDDEISSSNAAVRCECPVCGGTILGDWRLCPHCGSRITEASAE